MKMPALAAIAALLMVGFTAPAATAHGPFTDDKAYTTHCDGFALRCVQPLEDPTGGALCEEGQCRFGGAVWEYDEVLALHDYESGGLDIRAEVVDDVGQGDHASICAGQQRSDSDTQGNVCNDPESEPRAEFCGSSPWLTQAIKKDVGTSGFDEADFAAVFISGPVTQAWSNRPAVDPVISEGVGCDPLAAGGSTGTVTLFVGHGN